MQQVLLYNIEKNVPLLSFFPLRSAFATLKTIARLWKILKTQVQLILNFTLTHAITCLSRKIIRRKSHSQSIFIWEARLAPRQIINQIELTNRFNEI